MKQIMKQNKFKSKEKTTKVEVTGDTLTGRGGLALFVRYLSSINIYALLLEQFSGIRKSMKGVAEWKIFKQIFCYFYDGTSRHLAPKAPTVGIFWTSAMGLYGIWLQV